MQKFWKIAVVLACVVVIISAGVLWYRHHSTGEAVKSANAGDPKAQHELALRYFRGKGVRRNFPEAVKWWRKAAEQGYAKAQFNLGRMYHEGQGVPLDYGEALRWYNKAADQGFPRAQYAVGCVYFYGQGVPIDREQAVHWFTKAAEAGDAYAQESLGYVYYRGEGVPEDDAMALSWYRKAAEQGDATAENALAWMYANGRGTARDRVAALHWYRKAADDGDESAQIFLARKWSMQDKTLLAVQIFGGVILSVFPLGSRNAQSQSEFRRLLVGTVGPFTLLCACLRWYGYTHHKVRTCATGLNGFTVVQWTLSAITIALLFAYVVFTEKQAVQ